MYQIEGNNWLKHWDFILLDLMIFQISYIIAFALRHGIVSLYKIDEYREMSFIIILVELCSSFFLENYSNIIRRGYFEEFKKTIIQITTVIVIVFTYLFLTKSSDTYSRAVFVLTWLIAIILTYCTRTFRKMQVRKNMSRRVSLEKLVVVASSENVQDILRSFDEIKYKSFYISGIILIDESKEKYIMDIPVIACGEAGISAIRKNVVDRVFIEGSRKNKNVHEILYSCEKMGITTHYDLTGIFKSSRNTIVEQVAGRMVITSSIKFADSRQVFVKRVVDILGGIIGIIITGILTIILGPLIYIQDPGPIFFSQVRIGKNGRKFKIYKFRSMYMDAEEKKKELLAQNRMKDGLMFKVDFDTRVIGNKILSSGKKKKGIGNFIRVTSLDEFPQFFNVLKGDMSLVGTRPPTVDEWEKYEMHHYARMAIKPGITGMWQVSGRSNIIDFEEVVKLDTEYIENWSMALDFKILIKTVLAVVKKDGSM